MAEDWAKTVARKVEGRIVEEAERIATRRKRFDEGVERFRKQVLDLVASVNANIAAEGSRIQIIVLDTGISLAAAYKRIVTVEEIGPTESVPASVGKVVVHRDDRRVAEPPAPQEFYITSVGTQTAFYQRVGGKDLKVVGDADFRQIVEYFGS